MRVASATQPASRGLDLDVRRAQGVVTIRGEVPSAEMVIHASTRWEQELVRDRAGASGGSRTCTWRTPRHVRPASLGDLHRKETGCMDLLGWLQDLGRTADPLRARKFSGPAALYAGVSVVMPVAIGLAVGFGVRLIERVWASKRGGEATDVGWRVSVD